MCVWLMMLGDLLAVGPGAGKCPSPKSGWTAPAVGQYSSCPECEFSLTDK